MKSFRRELWFEVPARMGFVDVTRQVEACLAESGVREGLCPVNAMHITASVFVDDDEPGLHRDDARWPGELAPHHPSRYRHNETGEDNGDAQRERVRVEIIGE